MSAFPSSSPSGFRPRAVILVLLACTLLVTSCGHEESERLSIRMRFIEQEPSEEFSSASVTSYSVARSWRFESPSDLENWSFHGQGLSHAIEDRELVVDSEQPPPKLVWKTDLNASSIDAVEVELAEAPPGAIRLLWSDTRQRFSGHRSIRLRNSQGSDDHVYRFAVATHPLWKGHVARLRLDATLIPGRVVIREIRAVKGEIDDQRLTEALGHPWKAGLGDEVRNVLVAPPGLPLERSFQVPEHGVLRAAYGIQPGVRDPVRFRVRLESSEGGLHDLFDSTLRPSVETALTWHDVRADLSPWAGERVQLRLVTESVEDFALRRGFPLWAHPEVLAPANSQRPPNVVLVSIDTLRADRLSLYGHDRDTSPHLSRWASRRAVTFRNVVAPAPWTLPSHLSMMTGLDTLSHGRNFDDPIPSSVPLLAEQMRAAGYETLAVTGGGYLHPQYGWAQGFDRFVYWPSLQSDEELEHHVGQAINWLEVASEPFFLFFHSFEVHSPYRLRQPFYDKFYRGSQPTTVKEFSTGKRELTREEGYRQFKKFVAHTKDQKRKRELVDGELDQVRAAYDSGIAYMDTQMGRLLKHLEDRGLAENTIVVFTSDHGEALGEQGLAAHSYLYDFNLMVPLVIAAPGAPAAGTSVEQQVRLVDIVPTVLDLAGLKVPQNLDGVSLTAAFEGRPPDVPREAWSYAASSNFGISVRTSNRLKYIYNDTAWPAIHGDEELYRLKEDPEELHDESTKASESGELLSRVLERIGRDAGGLRVTFSNPGESPLRGTLTSADLVKTGTVKGRYIPCECVRRQPQGRLTFRVPPGVSYELYLKGRGSEPVQLSLRYGDDLVPFEHEFEIQDLDGPMLLARRDGTWGARDIPGAADPEISFEWRDRWGTVGELSPNVMPNAELREQLRALGYID